MVSDTVSAAPPIVHGPLYACTNRVGVRNLIVGASLELTVRDEESGAEVFTDAKYVRDPAYTEFWVTPELQDTHVVSARLIVDGVPSLASAEKPVRDYFELHPGDPVAPEILSLPVHECGERIYVKHINGAELTIKRTSVNGEENYYTSSAGASPSITAVDAPFEPGDTVSVRQKLCGQDSAYSTPPVPIQPAPSPTRSVNFGSKKIYSGQTHVVLESIVHGASVHLSEQTYGPVGTVGSWPLSSKWVDVETWLNRPLVVDDVLEVYQTLCSEDGPSPIESMNVSPCEEMAAPKIANPLEGDDFVLVTQAEPGARLRVYDENDEEIGDGSGAVISLIRPLDPTDVIEVTQQVGKCMSSTAYAIPVWARTVVE